MQKDQLPDTDFSYKLLVWKVVIWNKLLFVNLVMFANVNFIGVVDCKSFLGFILIDFHIGYKMQYGKPQTVTSLPIS